MIKRLILLLLVIAIFQPAPLEAQESGKKEVDLRRLPLNQLEEMFKTAVGDEKTLVINALAWKFMYSDPEKSLAYSQEALRRAKEAGKPDLFFDVFAGFGALYQVKKQFRESVRYYLEALKLEPYIKNKNKVAGVLTNIGMVYWNLQQHRKAEQYQRRALEIRKKIGASPYQLGYSLNNLGLALDGQDKHKEALEYYLEALDLFKEAGFKRGIAAALNNIATVYRDHIKDYPKALQYFLQAVPLYKEAGNRGALANAYQNIGSVYTNMRRFQEARKYMDMAMEEVEKTENQYEVLDIYEAYRDLFTEAGDFKAALEYSKKYDELGDRFFNAETNSDIARLMAEYDDQKKESEIQLLRKTNETRRRSLVFLAVLVLLSLAVAAVLYSRFFAKKKANRLLQLGEAKYRALFQQAGDAIFLVDLNGYVDCNQKAVEMFGVSREEIIGRTFAHFSPPTQPDGRDSLVDGLEWRKKVLEGQPRKFYWRFIKGDGTPIDTMVSLSAVTIDRQLLLQSIVHDITDQKRLEEERIKAAKLETTTLLAGGITHDFNNLLGIILGNIELAGAKLSPEDKALSYLSRMEKSARSAAELTRAFHTISEKEFQSRERAPIAAALRETVAVVLKESHSGVQCRFDIPSDLWSLECDIRQIKRAVENFTRNALEAMDAHGQLEVKAANVELETDDESSKAGRYISISIKDNGEGIPEENLSKVFDAYFTTRGDVSRRGLGTGLTVARGIIQHHHGTITVSSKPGKGTTILVYLPV
jgi:PAS domain S-box-containing protein